MLLLHGKAMWHVHIAADNDGSEWPGHDCNKEYKDFFKEDQRKRKGIPVLGPALCQGQRDNGRPEPVSTTAAIVPGGGKKH